MTLSATNSYQEPSAARADWSTVLAYLGLPPDDPATKALILLCNRYGLDPLLGHARIIGNRGAWVPYITRDGMLEVAHRSGAFDGMVDDEIRRNSTGDGWTAYVSVYRTDMSHPFRKGAQCKDSEPQARAGNGPEMAVARAERRALKRAFRIPTVDELDPGDLELGGKVTGADYVEAETLPLNAAPTVLDAGTGSTGAAPPPEPAQEPRPSAPDLSGTTTRYDLQGAAHRAIASLTQDERDAWLKDRGVAMPDVWPDAVVHDALEAPFVDMP